MRKLVFFVVFALVGYWALHQSGPRSTYSPEPTQSLNLCDRIGAGKAEKIIAYWHQAGVVREARGNNLIAEDWAWTATPHDAKVSIALAFFCRRHRDGRGTVQIKGYRDGKSHAYIVDGNYFDD